MVCGWWRPQVLRVAAIQVRVAVTREWPGDACSSPGQARTPTAHHPHHLLPPHRAPSLKRPDRGASPSSAAPRLRPSEQSPTPPRASAPARGPTTGAEPTPEGAEGRDWRTAAAAPRPRGDGPRPAPASPDRRPPAAAASRRPSPDLSRSRVRPPGGTHSRRPLAPSRRPTLRRRRSRRAQKAAVSGQRSGLPRPQPAGSAPPSRRRENYTSHNPKGCPRLHITSRPTSGQSSTAGGSGLSPAAEIVFSGRRSCPAAHTAAGLRRPSTRSQGRPPPSAGAAAAFPRAASPPHPAAPQTHSVLSPPPPPPPQGAAFVRARTAQAPRQPAARRSSMRKPAPGRARASRADGPLERGLRAVQNDKLHILERSKCPE
ncbi:translation initiation factor IF-2-like [Zalophus californianus]|uniref:Translation initiation factor IF-2-like n=1 Tax=Zalophus californianus TaxID=9704 RepID=A0A6J2DUS6_ZALCA|nr:translation initiation factor IF-2-like [Zalophus californianus]